VVAGGDELEEQVRRVVVEGYVADLVDLCGYPHRSTYSDTATMRRIRRSGVSRVMAVGICAVRAVGVSA
jgi:hypothetical protein